MHKARENNDGTFSIGKTWMLDDLSSIQSYNALKPKTPTEAQHKEWASSVGFVVTVGKPYYWHARSSKEKEFFIGSLVKIYKKYTGGKVPNLIGFDDRERQLLTGGTSLALTAPPARPGSKGGDGSAPPLSKSALASRDVSRNMSRDPSRDASRDGTRASSRDGSREVRHKASQDPTLRVQRSRDQLSQPSSSQGNPSISEPTSIPPSTILSGQRDLPPSRGNDVPTPVAPALPTQSINKEPTPPAPVEEKPPSASSRGEEPIQMPQPSTLQTTQAVESTTSGARHDNLRPSVGPAPGPLPTPTMVQQTSSQNRDTSDAIDTVSGESSKHTIPDARISLAQVSDPGVAAAFLAAGSPVEARKRPVELSAGSPTAAAPPAAPAPASPPAVTPAAAVPASPPAATPAAPAPASPSTIAPSIKSPTLTTPTSATAPPETPVEDVPEAHRPGLGPMVKKKSAKDIAGAFRKAANAYGAFKPRPGGAGERLLAAAKQPQEPEAAEPDGITGVVPAPSLTRSGTEPKSPVAETADRALPAPDKEATPTVKVTQPVFEETAVAAAVVAEESRDTFPDTVKVITDDRSRTPSPSGQGHRRRRQDNTLKYCQALGIEIGILDGRAIDFDDILSELGWNGRLNDEKRIEDLEADVRREVGRVEAVSWLGNLEQQDGKVEQLARLIDKTVEECEELDGLLTLYSHELNVSVTFRNIYPC